MTRRQHGLLVALGVGIVLLFAGRWTASFLADRWWAAGFSPAARDFVSGWHLLRLAIDAAGVTLAAGWFIGHLLILTRAVRSVQVPRHVGDIEFREALRPETLLAVALVAGALLGLVLGLDTSAYWPDVALAWHGVMTGTTDPVLGRDVGMYLAQLPLWRLLHEFAFLLVVVAFALLLTLYSIVGAVRIEHRRPAINDHARAHLGALLSAFALVLAWGYLLEPFELVAGLGGTVSPGAVGRAGFVAPALVGTALMVAALSALWALRPRHALMAAGWTILGIASVGGHYLAPVAMGVDASAPVADSALRALEGEAFALGGLRRGALLPAIAPAPLLDRAGVRRLFPSPDDVVSIDPTTIAVGASPRPAWLVLLARGRGTASLVAVAADRAGAAGGPLFYRPGDTLAYPTAYPYATLAATAARPGAPGHHVGTEPGGVALGSWLPRLMLAWALQAGELLSLPPPNTRVRWALAPAERLARLAPFAAWSSVRARIAEGRVVWLADGYLSARTFPLVDAVAWGGGPANSVRAAFLGVVDAQSGDARIYLREPIDSVAAAWAAIAAGVVEPAAALSPAIASIAGYPEELFSVQAALLARRRGGPGDLVVPQSAAITAVQPGWDSAGERVLSAAFAPREGDRVAALLVATGSEAVLLVADTTGVLVPRALERSWGRFATFAPIQDSISAAGARVETAPVRFWRSPEGLAAFQVTTAAREHARPAIVWVTVATGRRLGAGRSFADAWSNLQGTSVPLPPGATGNQISEAQHWMRIADAALKRGDWAAFGRAFEALRRVLQTESE